MVRYVVSADGRGRPGMLGTRVAQHKSGSRRNPEIGMILLEAHPLAEIDLPKRCMAPSPTIGDVRAPEMVRNLRFLMKW